MASPQITLLLASPSPHGERRELQRALCNITVSSKEPRVHAGQFLPSVQWFWGGWEGAGQREKQRHWLSVNKGLSLPPS